MDDLLKSPWSLSGQSEQYCTEQEQVITRARLNLSGILSGIFKVIERKFNERLKKLSPYLVWEGKEAKMTKYSIRAFLWEELTMH